MGKGQEKVGFSGTAAFPMVEPAYEAVYHTYDEMEEYLTKWVDAHGEHALPSAPPTAIPPPGPLMGA